MIPPKRLGLSPFKSFQQLRQSRVKLSMVLYNIYI